LGVSDIPVYAAFGIIIVCIIGLASYALFLLNRGTGLRN
jgi:ABC-2 type transport system permease protein